MSFKNWSRRNFLAGILVLVPLLGTIALFAWLFDKITGPGYKWLQNQLPDKEYAAFLKKNWVLFRLLVLFLMLGLTVLMGVLARNFLGRRIIRLGEALFERLPVVNRVFKALKQISEAFWGQNKTVFSHVVAVEYPRKGIYTIGFVTSMNRKDAKDKAGERLINVLLLTTPNPTSGYLVIVPEKEAVRLDMSVEDALKMIVSGGAVVPQGFRGVSALTANQKDEAKTAGEVEVSTTQKG